MNNRDQIRQQAQELSTQSKELSDQNKHEEANRLYLKAVTTLAEIPVAERTPDDWRRLALYQYGAGFEYKTLNNHQLSLEWFLKAVASQEQVKQFTLDDWRNLSVYQDHAGFEYDALNNHELSLEWYLKAVASREQVKQFTPDDWRKLSLHQDHAGFEYHALNNHELSLEWYLKAVASQEQVKQFTPNDWRELSASQQSAAIEYRELNNHQLSLEWYLKAVASREQVKQFTPDDWRKLSLYQYRAGIQYGALNNHQLSLEWYLKAVASREQVKQFTPDDWRKLSQTHHNIGIQKIKLGELKSARDHFYIALEAWLHVDSKIDDDFLRIKTTYKALQNIVLPGSLEQQFYDIASKAFSDVSLKQKQLVLISFTILEQPRSQDVHLLRGLLLFLRLLYNESDKLVFPNRVLKAELSVAENRDKLRRQLELVQQAYQPVSLFAAVDASPSLMASVVRRILVLEETVNTLRVDATLEEQQNPKKRKRGCLGQLTSLFFGSPVDGDQPLPSGASKRAKLTM